MLLSLLQTCNLLSLIAVVLIRGSPAAKRCFGNLCVCVGGAVIYGCPMIKRLSWHVVSGESGGWMYNVQLSPESQITVSGTANF